nr:unnamed protein product [Callosobruchus analis]
MNTGNLKIVQWNARSLQSNKHSLLQIFNEEHFDIAIVYETWYKRSHDVRFRNFTTRISPPGQQKSVVDITLMTTNLALSSHWAVMTDTYGSDHFPILITFNTIKTDDSLITPVSKWSMTNVKWDVYSAELESHLADTPIFQGANDMAQFLITSISNAANKSCKLLRPFSARVRSPQWWDEECLQAVNARRDSLRSYRNNLTCSNFLEYKRKQAICKRTFQTKAKNSWAQFCTSLNRQTNPSTIWNRVRSISNPKRYPPQDQIQIEALLHKIAPDYAPEATISAPVRSTETHFLLTPIKINELKANIKNSPKSAPGPDGISYKMLANLPDLALEFLCRIYNAILLEDAGVGAAVYVHNNGISIKYKMNPVCSIFTAELTAIELALDWASKTTQYNQYAILSDSLSSILALSQPTNHIFSNRIMTNLLEKELLLNQQNKSVTYVWVKGHSCIKGNEIVDRLAKDAAITGCNIDNITRRDIISTRKTHMRDQWEDQWRQFCRNSNTAYSKIHPSLPTTKLDERSHPNRKLNTLYIRCLFGHANINSYRLRMGLSETDTCDCNGDTDDLNHWFFNCRYNELATNNMLAALVATNMPLPQNHISLMVLSRVSNTVKSILWDFFKAVKRLI